MIGGDDTPRNVQTVMNSLTQYLIQNSSERPWRLLTETDI